ncbi:MAG: hypothetical protein WCK37_02870 [Candidatus Falkowbacteria bacterium]
MEKYFSWIFLTFSAAAVFILQRGLMDAWPSPYNRINLVLLSLLLCLFLFQLNKTIIFGVILGVLLDIFSFNFFGVNTLSIFLSLLFAGFLLDNWLTHRSAYSFLALTFFTIIFYNFTLYLLIYLTGFLHGGSFFLWSGNFWLGLLSELFWNLIIIFGFFVIMNLTSNRLKLVFLDKK